MIHVWHFPTRIVFGENASERLGEEVEALGKRIALVVTEPDLRESGVVRRVEENLKARGLGVVVFDAVDQNPTERVALEASLVGKGAGADVIVAVGGGSAIDVAKLVAVCSTNPPPLSAYASAAPEPKELAHAVPPIVAVPTTAGSGAEVSPDAFVELETLHRKASITSPLLVPSTVILDPTLTAPLSPELTASGGFLALAQAIEAYLAKGDHPMADAIALEAIGLVAHHLERAVEDGTNLKDRGALQKAATLAGVAASKGQGPSRSVAHALSTIYGISHALGCALVLPAVVDFARTGAPERVARVASALGARGSDVETLAFEASGALRALRRRVGLPETMDSAGVRDVDAERVAELAYLDEGHLSSIRVLDLGDLTAIVRASQ